MEKSLKGVRFMNIAIIDCFSGISGDMTLASLLDSGVPLSIIEDELKKLELGEFQIKVSKTERNHITATKVDVDYDTTHHPHRHYNNIVDMINKSKLSETIKMKALKAFEVLGKAEAKIHGRDLKHIHFHEVGAVDSIVDLVGSIIGFEYLEVDHIYSTPVPLGGGFTKSEHGIIPVPSPAALEILKDYPVINRKSDYEMTTPTGATLIKILSNGIVPLNFSYTYTNIGYGAGSKDSPQWPNLLRIIKGKTDRNSQNEFLYMIECNIDDMNPEIYTYVIEKLYKAGAKDVFITPVIMKKGRPGTQLSVLTQENNLSEVEKTILLETTTIGLRKYAVERRILERYSKTVNSKFGKIQVKVIKINEKEVIRPEYEVCKEIAEKQKIKIIDIYREIESLNL
jgi:uncharacterized protein (TIGR00299 family) protein